MSVNRGQRYNHLEAGAFVKNCVLLFSQHSDRVSKLEKSCYRFTGTQWTISSTNERNVITLCVLKGKVVAASISGLTDQTSQALESGNTDRMLGLAGMWPEDTDYLRFHMDISGGI